MTRCVDMYIIISVNISIFVILLIKVIVNNTIICVTNLYIYISQIILYNNLNIFIILYEINK